MPATSVAAEVVVPKPDTLHSVHQLKKGKIVMKYTDFNLWKSYHSLKWYYWYPIFFPAQSRNPCRTHTEPKRNFYADNLKAESNTQYKKLLNEYQKAKKQLTYANRVKRALKFSKTENFEKLTCNMNPIARKILWMQVHLCTKKTKGRRFTDEEKMIALAIMKQSPRSYKFLRRIFILPSGRTINKLISNLKVDSGINSQIFRAIKTEVYLNIQNFIIIFKHFGNLFVNNVVILIFRLKIGQKQKNTAQ